MTRARTIGPMLGAALIASAGCSALINPDPGRLGDDPDAGAAVDAARPDSGSRPDTGTPALDSGPVPCESSEPICRGDGLVTCAGGVESVRDCNPRARSARAGAAVRGCARRAAVRAAPTSRP